MGNGQWVFNSLLENRENEILEGAKEEPVAIIITMRRLEWLGRVIRRDETEHARADEDQC